MHLIAQGKNFSIINEVGKKNFPLKRVGVIVEKILGKKAVVSIVFVSTEKIRQLNKKYRGNNESTDVLSFRLDKNTGEIFLSPSDLFKKAKSFLPRSKAGKLQATDYLHYLLIHALFHLKGLSHGSKMDRQEKRFCKLFSIKYPFLNEF